MKAFGSPLICDVGQDPCSLPVQILSPRGRLVQGKWRPHVRASWRSKTLVENCTCERVFHGLRDEAGGALTNLFVVERLVESSLEVRPDALRRVPQRLPEWSAPALSIPSSAHQKTRARICLRHAQSSSSTLSATINPSTAPRSVI